MVEDWNCPHCKTEFDGTGTCMYDCMDGYCGLCGEDVPRFTKHNCPKLRKEENK